nr:hypothetical protein GCM10020092_101280 [Actinoplanes digitatis]
MSVDFGTPPEGDNIRSLVEERLKQVMAEHGAKVTVDWRGEQRHLHVISMPVDMLYFNPDTHRIRAQRTLDPPAKPDARGKAVERGGAAVPASFADAEAVEP